MGVVKAGVSARDLAMSSYHNTGAFATGGRSSVIGPSVELRFPFGLGIEVDALYRHVNHPSGSAWEIPILAKFRVPVRESVTPYVVGGGSFQRNNRLRAFQVGPSETVSGLVFGGGVEAKMGIIRLAPEIRYTLDGRL